MLLLGAATVASAATFVGLAPQTSRAQAEEVDVPPDVEVYERYGGAQGYYWSTDPASTPGGEFGDANQPLDLWSTPPGEGFTMLYRVDRDNGKYFLTTDPGGEGAGPTTPLGYIGTTREAVEAVLDPCRYTAGVDRYYLEGERNRLDGSVNPIDYHLVGEPMQVDRHPDGVYRDEGTLGFTESVESRGPCPTPWPEVSPPSSPEPSPSPSSSESPPGRPAPQSD